MLPDTLPSQWWWYLLPAYLTLWSIGFGIWNFVDGPGMFRQFKINFAGNTPADLFIIKNSAARYLGIAVALMVGIWVLRSPAAAFTALLARLLMDVLDWVAGLQTGILKNQLTGSIQAFLMFMGPGLLSIVLLFLL
ncbi:MAG: hypothetical protein AAF633_10510 [Chloroflexota bacterium]